MTELITTQDFKLIMENTGLTWGFLCDFHTRLIEENEGEIEFNSFIETISEETENESILELCE